MNIELSELVAAFAGKQNRHPMVGKKVVAVSAHGFVHIGTLDEVNGYLLLRSAKNVRFWSKRGGGLPELARDGIIDTDKVDECTGPVYLNSLVLLMEYGR